MSEKVEDVNYRDEVLRRVTERKIRHTKKYVEKASDETVKKFTRII